MLTTLPAMVSMWLVSRVALSRLSREVLAVSG
jgi:hypothetical protein